MSPAEIQAIIALGTKVFEAYQAHQVVLEQIKAKDPAAYAQISAAHAATGHHLDAAAAP